jgi:hypothetical protein
LNKLNFQPTLFSLGDYLQEGAAIKVGAAQSSVEGKGKGDEPRKIESSVPTWIVLAFVTPCAFAVLPRNHD